MRPWLGSAVMAALFFVGVVARADDAPEPAPVEENPSAIFASATAALSAERHAEAIARFEALADRGVVDPVVSYDRGLAYAARVRAKNEQPGDLGRAAHGNSTAMRP